MYMIYVLVRRGKRMDETQVLPHRTVQWCTLTYKQRCKGLSRLQSSLHRDHGMGVVTQSILYVAAVTSSLFLARFIIRILRHKWAICVPIFGYMTWMAANGYAVWGTMVTTSIIVGICAAPLWIAQASYFAKLGTRYSNLTGEKEDVIIVRFFGIFCMFFQMSNIFGSVIMTTVIYKKPNNISEPSAEELQKCGANDNPWKNDTNVNMEKPDSTTLWTLVGVYIGVAAVAMVGLAVFMDPLPKEMEEEGKEKGKSVGKQTVHYLLATIKHMRKKEQLLLIPLSIYGGLEQALYGAEWIKSFISCPLGIWQVGLVTLPFGFVNAATSILSSHLLKYTGRIPMFTTAFLLDLCIQITMMTWMPRVEKAYVLYILSGLWGITDAIWGTQVRGLYGVVFAKEHVAAFSNNGVWESLGFILGFAWSNFLPTSMKIYIATGVLCAGMIGYYILELTLHKNATIKGNLIEDTALRLLEEDKEPMEDENTHSGSSKTQFL